MEKKQSSIDKFVQQLKRKGLLITEDSEYIVAYLEAKAMHKKEILIAYSKALPITDGVFTAIDKAHDYYIETFGGKNE